MQCFVSFAAWYCNLFKKFSKLAERYFATIDSLFIFLGGFDIFLQSKVFFDALAEAIVSQVSKSVQPIKDENNHATLFPTKERAVFPFAAPCKILAKTILCRGSNKTVCSQEIKVKYENR